MLGALYGDIAGSVYEFHNTHDYNFRLMGSDARPTDDSFMSLAVAEALMNTYGEDDETIQKALVRSMQEWGRRYPGAGYGGMFRQWLRMENPRPYHSFGNGSAMRVSSAGWLYDNLDDVLHAAALSASVTHDHPEGIKGAQAIASCILLARFKFSKEDILKYMYLKFGYDMDFTLDEIRDHNRFDETCQVTVPQAVRAFYEGKSFEDVIRLSISLGGDSDTIACMAGGIAEAYYGMREKQRRQVSDHMDPYCRSMIRKYHAFYLSHAGR